MERDKLIMLIVMILVIIVSSITVIFNNNRRIHKYAEYADSAVIQGISGNPASGLIYELVINKSETVKVQESQTVGFYNLTEGSVFEAVVVTDKNGNIVAVVNVKGD